MSTQVDNNEGNVIMTNIKPTTGLAEKVQDTAFPSAKGFALAGFFLAIASIFIQLFGIVTALAVIFSALGLARSAARRGAGLEETYYTLARAGIIISAVAVVVNVVYVGLFV